MNSIRNILSNVHLPLDAPYRCQAFSNYLPELPHQVLQSHGLKYTDLKSVLDKIPPEETPDALVIRSPEYLPIPGDLHVFHGPKILLITDWNVCTRFLKDICPLFDYCFTDLRGAQLLQSWGLDNVHHLPLFGHHPETFRVLPEWENRYLERPYDVSFSGNLNTALHFQRNQWLCELARLKDSFKICIKNVFHREYVELLNQSKLVWNYSIRGETNMRVYESMACGAVPLIEESNEETPRLFREGEHYLSYNNYNLKEVIRKALADPDRLEAMSRQAGEAVAHWTQRKQMLSMMRFVEENPVQRDNVKVEGEPRARFEADPAPGEPDDQALQTVLKVNILGLGYAGSQILELLAPHFDHFPHLEGEVVPGVLLQFYLDSVNKQEPNAKIADFLETRVFGKMKIPDVIRAYFQCQFYTLKLHWDRAMECGNLSLSQCESLLEKGEQKSDKRLYRFLMPPLSLGGGLTNDLNRCYEKDARSGSCVSLLWLLRERTLAFLVEGRYCSNDREGAISYLKKMTGASYHSVSKTRWEAKIYPEMGEASRSIIAFNQLFEKEPLQFDHWTLILEGCQTINRMDLWQAYAGKFLDLTKTFYPNHKQLREVMSKVRSTLESRSLTLPHGA